MSGSHKILLGNPALKRRPLDVRGRPCSCSQLSMPRRLSFGSQLIVPLSANRQHFRLEIAPFFSTGKSSLRAAVWPQPGADSRRPSSRSDPSFTSEEPAQCGWFCTGRTPSLLRLSAPSSQLFALPLPPPRMDNRHQMPQQSARHPVRLRAWLEKRAPLNCPNQNHRRSHLQNLRKIADQLCHLVK